MNILNNLNWRYAVRKFDENKIVPEDKIMELLEITNLSPSALGLQPYKFIVIHDKELQLKLQEHSNDQTQVGEASHLIVFATKTEISQSYISNYVEQTENVRNLEIGSMNDSIKTISDIMSAKSSEDFFHWAQKQAYLALGVLILAAADMEIDLCPLELIDSKKYNEVLGLDKEKLHTCVVATIGYRSNEDSLATENKSRREFDDIVQLRY